jgi:hypothetical protein
MRIDELSLEPAFACYETHVLVPALSGECRKTGRAAAVYVVNINTSFASLTSE